MNPPKQKRRLRLVASVRTTYAIMDEMIPQEMHAEGAAEKITCKRGCNACCRMQVILTAAEAIAIAERHAAFIATRLDELKAQATLVQDMIKEREHMSREDRDMDIASAWWPKQIQCALLLENGDCGVYETRPLVCRTHFVVTERALCEAVPTEIIGHWVPIDLRDEGYARLNNAWIAAFESKFPAAKDLIYPIGALPKMVLLAFNERKAQ